MKEPVISLVIHGHMPYIRHAELALSTQECWFFQSLSETYIPLLEVLERLEHDRIPCKIGLSLSPTLLSLLTDDLVIQRYLDYTDRQIEFGAQELTRNDGNKALYPLIKLFYDRMVDKRVLFTERYEKNILKVFEYFQKKGRIELLATSATHAFLPFYTTHPEVIQAQFEVAISTYRSTFGKCPQGFWLPELGWKEDLAFWLRAYNFSYTIVDTHALMFAKPFAKRGSFYPARTPQSALVFGRDFYAANDIARISHDPLYRRNKSDQGFDLPLQTLKPFLNGQGSRMETGYKYWANGSDGSSSKIPYDPDKAALKASEHAREFLGAQLSRLKKAAKLMDESPLCLCAVEADSLGRFWYEGSSFIEALFREGAKTAGFQFMTLAEYLCKQDMTNFQTLEPEFSSWGFNGYAETWLSDSNDWMCKHTAQALQRMVEIAERFPNSSGLKERVLNQAAREILLALGSDWQKMLYRQESSSYAKSRIEESLRNFTTIYESLGSGHISTEFLTHLEKRNGIFPAINYRVFRRKR